MNLFCRFRPVLSCTAPVLACFMLASTAKADPPALPGSASAKTVTLRTRAASTTALTVASDSGNGSGVTLVATVVSRGAAPAGSVVFTLQGKRIGEVAVANGAASMTLETLPAGLSSLSASFQGDGNLLPSTSSTVRFYQDDQN